MPTAEPLPLVVVALPSLPEQTLSNLCWPGFRGRLCLSCHYLCCGRVRPWVVHWDLVELLPPAVVAVCPNHLAAVLHSAPTVLVELVRRLARPNRRSREQTVPAVRRAIQMPALITRKSVEFPTEADLAVVHPSNPEMMEPELPSWS